MDVEATILQILKWILVNGGEAMTPVPAKVAIAIAEPVVEKVVHDLTAPKPVEE